MTKATFTKAVKTCRENNCELPVPTSMAENAFIGSIGETFLGIRGAFDDGVATWNNIYTKVYLITRVLQAGKLNFERG